MIRVIHLYAKEMNIYGDRGNVIALLERLAWRKIEAKAVTCGIGEELKLKPGDILFIGGGQDKGQVRVAADLQTKANVITEAVRNNIPLLAICGGYQLLGHYFEDKDGTRLEGIGVFDAHTVGQDERMIGNIVVENKHFGKLIGFENHSGQTHLAETQAELGVVRKGFGNNGQDQGEGAITHNAIGTYLHGSFLPKNPIVADWLIEIALAQAGINKKLSKLDDGLEKKAAETAAKLPQ